MLTPCFIIPSGTLALCWMIGHYTDTFGNVDTLLDDWTLY
jgi:hypothetical protein